MEVKYLLLIFLCIFYGSSCEESDWWTSIQLYQIYPRSFKDSNGDGIGDINGIISKLDHLVNIGVNATWLSPVYPSPMKDFGYDISDYYGVAEEYGTMEELETLIDEATKRNIRILLDFVPNHTSDECEWFKKSALRDPKYKDFYIWHDGLEGGTKPPSNWLSFFGGSAWAFHPIRQQWYLHQFLKEQPDLNYRNPLVVDEMKNVLRFWLMKGIAGFRVDAIPYLFEADVDEEGNYPDEPLSGDTVDLDNFFYLSHIYTMGLNETYDQVFQWREVLDEVTATIESETKIMVMEAMDIRYYGNETHEGAHFPLNFYLVFLDKNANASVIGDIILGWYEYLPPGRVTNWMIGNHDVARAETRYGPDRIDGIIMIAMLLPGVAVTYNGEEIGMTNFYLSWEDTVDPQGCIAGIEYYNTSSRDPARTPFQWDFTKNAGFSSGNKTWLPVNDNYQELNLYSQMKETKSAFKFYQNLSNLRQTDEFKRGNLGVIVPTDEVLIITRSFLNSTSIVMVNTSNETFYLDIEKEIDQNIRLLTVLAASRASPKFPGNELFPKMVELLPFEALALSTIQ